MIVTQGTHFIYTFFREGVFFRQMTLFKNSVWTEILYKYLNTYVRKFGSVQSIQKIIVLRSLGHSESFYNNIMHYGCQRTDQLGVGKGIKKLLRFDNNEFRF